MNTWGVCYRCKNAYEYLNEDPTCPFCASAVRIVFLESENAKLRAAAEKALMPLSALQLCITWELSNALQITIQGAVSALTAALENK